MSKNPTLKRSLSLTALVFFGLAYMTPMGSLAVFGIAENVTLGMTAGAYLITIFVMAFTVYSYSQMVKAYPVAGSTYSYTQKSLHPNMGFLVGWTILLDYLFIPMINTVLAGIFMHAAFPVVPVWSWILIYLSVIVTINVLGIKIATRTNILLFLFQAIVLITFLVLCIQSIIKGEGTGTLFSVLPFVNVDIPFSNMAAGAAILAFSFLGFDSVTMLTEEAKNPKKNVPRAMFFIIFIASIFLISTAYFAHQVFPNFENYTDMDSAIY